MYIFLQDNFKKFVHELEEVHEQWDEDVREFVCKVFDHVTPAAEVRCPKDMEALVRQDVQQIISQRGPQKSRAYLKQLLSTWHEGECSQCLVTESCACLSCHAGWSKCCNDMHGVQTGAWQQHTRGQDRTGHSQVASMCSMLACMSPDIGMCPADKNRQAMKGTHKVISQILIEGLKQC